MTQLLMLHPNIAQFAADASESGVQTLTADHAVSLARLLNAAFEENSWTEKTAVEKLLAAADILGVVGVVEDGTVVATASARIDPANFPGQGYVHMVASGLSARGKGYGRSATEAVLALFVAEGITEAVLETDDWRLPALRTYLGMGFVPVIRDHSHYGRWSAILETLHPRSMRSSAPIVKETP